MADIYVTGKPETRRCKACGRDLPLECFSPAKRTEDGISYRCTQCINEGKAQTERPAQEARVSLDTNRTLNEIIREQAESTILAYIAECERRIKGFDINIASIKLQRHVVAVNLANARRKIQS